MKLTFPLGMALVFIGLALASLVNYLDMWQFETRLDGFVSRSSVSDFSGIYQSVKANDAYAQKYISPETSAGLLRDYSTIDLHIKAMLQDICHSVSKKKSDALHGMGTFLCLAAMMGMLNYSAILKAKNQSVKLG
jgi:hypothetical protein